MIDLITEKKLLLEEMLLFTKQQAKALKDENFEELEKLLDEKDVIIEKIDDIDLRFRSLKLEGQVEDEETLSLLSQIEKVLNNIKILDDANNKKLSQAMTEMKGDLKDLRQGKRAVDGYRSSDPYQTFASLGGTLFIDQDS